VRHYVHAPKEREKANTTTADTVIEITRENQTTQHPKDIDPRAKAKEEETEMEKARDEDQKNLLMASVDNAASPDTWRGIATVERKRRLRSNKINKLRQQ
jgi:hypothetical protein